MWSRAGPVEWVLGVSFGARLVEYRRFRGPRSPSPPKVALHTVLHTNARTYRKWLQWRFEVLANEHFDPKMLYYSKGRLLEVKEIPKWFLAK